MQDQRDALLVVGDAQAVGALAVDAERLVLEHAAQIDRVHVGDQQHLLLPVPFHCACTIAPVLAGVSSMR